MIVGKLRGQNVPILIRTGAANATITTGIPPFADDESGISMLSPQTLVALNSVNGEYIGVDSQFDYRTTALEGTQATLLDPFNAIAGSLSTRAESGLHADLAGLVTSTLVGASTGTTPTGSSSSRAAYSATSTDQPDDAVLHDRLIRAVTVRPPIKKAVTRSASRPATEERHHEENIGALEQRAPLAEQ